jgi:hypothetical protein
MKLRSSYIVALGLAAGAALGASSDSLDAQVFVKEISDRVQRVKPSDDVGWATIPWTSSLLEARKLGRRQGAFIFLFTHQGNLESGRC